MSNVVIMLLGIIALVISACGCRRAWRKSLDDIAGMALMCGGQALGVIVLFMVLGLF